MNAAIIAGIVLAAQYLGIFDTALNAAIDIEKKISAVLPHKAKAAPIPKVPFVVVPKKKVVNK